MRDGFVGQLVNGANHMTTIRLASLPHLIFFRGARSTFSKTSVVLQSATCMKELILSPENSQTHDSRHEMSR